MKSLLFESILQESSVNEDEILRVTGMSVSDIEDAFDCTILMGPVSHRKDGYWLFINDHDDGAGYIIASEIEEYKKSIISNPKKQKKTPQIACMFLGTMDLQGPFTRKELGAAYGHPLGGTAFAAIYQNYPLQYVGTRGREHLYKIVKNSELDKHMARWSQCYDFDEAKKAAEERVLALRK